MNAQWESYFENLFDSKLTGIKEGITMIDQKIDKNMETMNSNLTLISEEIKGIKQLQVDQGKQIEILKNEERSTNLIFHGLNEENYHNTLKKIIVILNSVEIEGSKYLIRNIRKLGKGDWKGKPVLVSLISVALKIDILRNKKRISELYQDVIIKEDMTQETRDIRKQLSKYSEMATSNNIKAYMRGDKLVVHGKQWSIDELARDKNKTFLINPKRGREEETSPNKGNEKRGTPNTQHQLKRVNSLENYVIKKNTMDTSETLLDPQTNPEPTTSAVKQT